MLIIHDGYVLGILVLEDYVLHGMMTPAFAEVWNVIAALLHTQSSSMPGQRALGG